MKANENSNVTEVDKKSNEEKIGIGKLTVEEFNKLVEEFRKGKKKFMDEWYTIGYNEGIAWVKSETYDEVVLYVDNIDYRLENGIPWPPYSDDQWLDRYLNIEIECPPSAEDSFWKGFSDGIVCIWNEINKHI